MPLALIEKHTGKKDSASIKIKRHLTEKEASLLAEFYILGWPLLAEDKKQVRTLSRSIYEQDLWVQCDCTERSKPVFRFNRSVNGKIYMHHITSRGNHTDLCVFKEKVWEKTKSEAPQKPFVNESEPLNLVLKKAFSLGIKSKKFNTENNRNISENQRSTLCNALYRLLDNAKANVINPQKIGSTFKAIQDAARYIEIQPQKKTSDYLYMHPSLVFKAAFALRSDKSFWPKDTSKHALLLIKARSFNEESIEALLPNGETKTIRISQKIYRSSGRLGARSSPFLALILITDSVEKPYFYEPTKAFVVPCYSEKTFIPVDSHYEREVIKKLFALQFKLSKRCVNLEIIKPLFDIPIFDKRDNGHAIAYVLPDFILKTNEKTLVIEVNGSHEADYLERKQRTHQFMSAIGEVFSIDAYGAEKENRLMEAINQLMSQIIASLNRP
ncbi:MAG: hypothetical protein WCR08_02680 [Gammaproteobacteria bacterium]